MTETREYEITRIRSIKCWEELELENAPSIILRRTKVNESLLERIANKKVKIIKIKAHKHPPSNSDIISISYEEKLYPFYGN